MENLNAQPPEENNTTPEAPQQVGSGLGLDLLPEGVKPIVTVKAAMTEAERNALRTYVTENTKRREGPGTKNEGRQRFSTPGSGAYSSGSKAGIPRPK